MNKPHAYEGSRIVIGANNYQGLSQKAGSLATIVKVEQVLDRTYGGRPCHPIGYTTHYAVKTDDGVWGTLFAGQFKLAPQEVQP